MVVESFLIITVAAFYFAVVSRCTRTDSFMFDTDFRANHIQWMSSVCFFNMSKFSTVVGLKYISVIDV